jgi:hypothetical protein
VLLGRRTTWNSNPLMSEIGDKSSQRVMHLQVGRRALKMSCSLAISTTREFVLEYCSESEPRRVDVAAHCPMTV